MRREINYENRFVENHFALFQHRNFIAKESESLLPSLLDAINNIKNISEAAVMTTANNKARRRRQSSCDKNVCSFAVNENHICYCRCFLKLCFFFCGCELRWVPRWFPPPNCKQFYLLGTYSAEFGASSLLRFITVILYIHLFFIQGNSRGGKMKSRVHKAFSGYNFS